MNEIQYEIDNRDTSTTWLTFNDNYVEVNPFELLENAIENSHLNDEEQSILIEKLNEIKQKLD